MEPFTGIWDHRVDDKDRVVVPAAFANLIRAESDGRLYLAPNEALPCVEAYPARIFDELARGNVINRFEGDPLGRRFFFHTAHRVELKGPGRILIPKRLLHFFPARLVRVAGANTYLELWDPKRWEECYAEASTSALRERLQDGRE